jgi:glucokinase
MGNILSLDVGGTQIKSCVCDFQSGNRISPLSIDDAHSYEKREIILANFLHIIQKHRAHYAISGIGIAFPGPFDYQKGISLLQGIGKRETAIGKYDALYQFPLGEWLEQETGLPIRFGNDADLFGLGAYHWINPAGYHRLLALCIGTGFGSYLIEDGQKISSIRSPRDNGWLYNFPYREATADRYLSAAGLERLILEAGHPAKDGKALFEAAQAGDIMAISLFEQFGSRIAEFLNPILPEIHPDYLVIGGQIAKSYSYFGKNLTSSLSIPKDRIYPEENSSEITLQAATLLFSDTKS